MKALTLHQPYATLIALGIKTIETRSWRTKYRGPLAIHASASTKNYGSYADWYFSDWLSHLKPEIKVITALVGTRVPLGAIVATCTLVDCIPCDEEVMTGPRAFTRIGGFENWHKGDCYVSTYRDGNDDEYGGPDYGGRTWDLEANLPYGNFLWDRWLWLLADVKPIEEPIPAKGKQGLWEWTP
jgi:activating signal cointegrator 1